MRSTRKEWFHVDRTGLAKLIDGKSKAFALFELVQNAWDQNVSRVEIDFRPVDGQAAVVLSVVDDDPEGFQNLAHAYTLFAESAKKGDPEKRGRFNLGEKLVLALCTEARIVTTSGGFEFLPNGQRKPLRRKREVGSEFYGKLRMSREEYRAALEALHMLLPREGVSTYVNGALLPPRVACKTFRSQLRTVIADEQGVLREAKRETEVRLYEPVSGEPALLYEMGIPVVETGDRWHVDVRQKVPLNMNRDNVPAAYLRDLRTAVLNQMHPEIDAEIAASDWVNQALPNVSGEAVSAVLDARYGKLRVSHSVDDAEANRRAVAAGYHVIPPRAFSKEQWENVRRAGAVVSAGKLFPTPRPYGPGGEPEKVIPHKEWTPEMEQFAAYSTRMGELLLGQQISVKIVNEPNVGWVANYGGCVLTLNVGRLGRNWFKAVASEDGNALLLHEFAHHFERDHLSDAFHDAICDLGAKMTALALATPEAFLSKG